MSVALRHWARHSLPSWMAKSVLVLPVSIARSMAGILELAANPIARFRPPEHGRLFRRKDAGSAPRLPPAPPSHPRYDPRPGSVQPGGPYERRGSANLPAFAQIRLPEAAKAGCGR